MKKWLKRLGAVAVLGFLVDMAIFATWWHSCPLRSKTMDGGTLLIRELHFNPFMYYPGWFRVWEPGFWWVEHVGGWKFGSWMGMESASVLEYYKFRPEPAAAPNSRPPAQLPTSPETRSSDSQRTSSSGGGG